MYAEGYNNYDQYRQIAVQTAGPGKLLLMLYDGLTVFLKQAVQAVEDGEFGEAHRCLIRAQDIITELMCTLDMKYEVAKNLFRIYDYLKRRLVEANVKKDSSIVEEVLGLVAELKETWEQIIEPSKVSASR